jgi:hypothetical protein
MGLKSYHNAEIKWFKDVMIRAFSMIKIPRYIEVTDPMYHFKYEDTRTRGILDLCCGPGRLI